LNWQSVRDRYVINFSFFDAEYLFIYPTKDYADEVAPLVTQKKARGFRVTELIASDIGTSCEDFRDAIRQWEGRRLAGQDVYALLIGDVDVIPLCTAPTGNPTDDLYASTNGDDLDEEIYVGRLSVDDQADAARQIAKILEYEDNPSPFCCYDRATLWAHKEGAPMKYEGAHEKVRSNSYSNRPTFSTIYGSKAASTDADINDNVDTGVGVLAYRGHGSETATATGWNQDDEFYETVDVTALSNPIARSPVVWSFACSNTGLSTDDAISEAWMEEQDAGAVSYYGATVPSLTSQNHVLDEWMFRAVYDEGLITQAHAVERGEEQMAALSGDDNAWMYLLLGDPEMKIRTKNPRKLVLDDIPRQLAGCRPRPCDIAVRVIDEVGNPVPEARVSFWKAGRDRGTDEVFVNGYADESGRIKLPVSPTTPGTLFYAVDDGEGNASSGTISVR
jgi:hypothetical protein